jgi:hypothetical protein
MVAAICNPQQSTFSPHRKTFMILDNSVVKALNVEDLSTGSREPGITPR